jgi:hypothetical protein
MTINNIEKAFMISDHKNHIIMKINLHLITDQKVEYFMFAVVSLIHL